MTRPRTLLALAFTLLLGLVSSSRASELRWAVQADVLTLDPHALLHLPSNALLMQVYEGLVRYDAHYQVEPALARRWRWIGPRQLRFELREDVRFHNGSPLSADDVVFSFERLTKPSSQLKVQLEGVRAVVARDARTVDLFLERPQPLLLRNLVDAKIMNRRWAESRLDGDIRVHAMGTGPYRLEHWLPDRELLLRAFAGWWGRPPVGDTRIDTVRVLPLRNDASRTAALLSGAVDLVTDVPPQDIARLRSEPGLRVQQGDEIRTVFIALDTSPEPLAAGQSGNPLQDRRVREALSLAVDREALRTRLLNGMARPAALMVAPGIWGHDPGLDRPQPQQLPLARQRLAQAGFPDGFAMPLHCPNNRYPRDEAVCQAVVQMWAQIGVRAQLIAQPMAQHLPAIQSGAARAYLYGWTAPNFDAQFTLQTLVQSPQGSSAGSFNHTHLRDPELDATLTALAQEDDPSRRRTLARKALLRVQQEQWFIPLYHTVRAWAMRRDLEAQHRLDERPELRWMRFSSSATP